MNTHLRRKRLAIILSLTSIIVLIISGCLVYERYQCVLRINSDIITNYQTIRAANQALISINEAALGVSTFLYSKNPEAIKKLPEIIVAAQVNLAALTQLTQDDTTEIELTAKLNQLMDKKIEFLRKVIYEYSAGRPEYALKIASQKSRLQETSSLTQRIVEIKKIESGQVDEAIARYEIDKIKVDKFFILLGSLNVLLGLFNFIFIRRLLA